MLDARWSTLDIDKLASAGSRKDGRAVRFPLELHLAREWMSDQSDHVRGAALNLIATVAHHGKTMQAGHYTVRDHHSNPGKRTVTLTRTGTLKTTRTSKPW
jgi:hypothetical protein